MPNTIENTNTLYIPSTLNSYFLEKLRKLPAVGAFTCYGERADVIAYKIYGDVNMQWIIKAYNNITHPHDGSLATGQTITFPSLNAIEKLYSTLTAKQRADRSNS